MWRRAINEIEWSLQGWEPDRNPEPGTLRTRMFMRNRNRNPNPKLRTFRTGTGTGTAGAQSENRVPTRVPYRFRDS